MDWSAKIRELRYLENLKQDVLAGQLGVSQASVSQWERGVCEPPRRVRDLLRDRLCVSPSHSLLSSLKLTVEMSHSRMGLFPVRSGSFHLHCLSPGAYQEYGLLDAEDVGTSVHHKLGDEAAAVQEALLEGQILSGDVAYAETIHTESRAGIDRFGLYKFIPYRISRDSWAVLATYDPMDPSVYERSSELQFISWS